MSAAARKQSSIRSFFRGPSSSSAAAAPSPPDAARKSLSSADVIDLTGGDEDAAGGGDADDVGDVDAFVQRAVRDGRCRDEALLRGLIATRMGDPMSGSRLWTRLFQASRCATADVDAMVTAWLEAFLDKKPYDDEDDVIVGLERHRVEARDRARHDDNWLVDDSDDDVDDTPALCRVVVLRGPVGSGKTSAIHACLAKLNSDSHGVIEINTSDRRSKSDLESRFKEATQSSWVTDGPSSAKPSKRDAKRRRNGEGVRALRRRRRHCALLIDDVDVVLDGDTAFVKGVQDLAVNTRRPIVLTCADLPDDLSVRLPDAYVFDLSEPDGSTMVEYATSVAIAMGARQLPSVDNLSSVIDYFHHDWRRLLNAMQFWIPVHRRRKLDENHLSAMGSIDLYRRVTGAVDAPALGSDRADRSILGDLDADVGPDVAHLNYLSLLDDDCPLLASLSDAFSLSDVWQSATGHIPDLSGQVGNLVKTTTASVIGIALRHRRGGSVGSATELRHCPSVSPGVDQAKAIWFEHRKAWPRPTHSPSSRAFLVDHGSAIRQIQEVEQRRQVEVGHGRSSRRRFVHYLHKSLTRDGLELVRSLRHLAPNTDASV
ncbi:AAA+ ATPase domain-containing protein [Plasmodiophora brassicae]